MAGRGGGDAGSAGKRPAAEVGTLAKAIEILDIVGAAPHGISLADLVPRLGMPKSTVHRLAMALCRANFLRKDPSRSVFQLGLRLAELGELALESLQLRDIARPLLVRLAYDLGETVHMATVEGDRAVYVEKVEVPNMIRMYSAIGRMVPLHCTGVGKALLAFSSPAFQEKIITAGLEQHTQHSICHPDRLRAELAAIRERGYALDLEEIELGLHCAGAPVFSHQQECVAAISVAGPMQRLPLPRLEEIAGQIMRVADLISEQLGWRPPLSKRVPLHAGMLRVDGAGSAP
jgi:DNA-binding IclR family transcriptional regulator